MNLAGKIVVVGHGTGKSNAAHHLLEYLKSHHSETHQRVVSEMCPPGMRPYSGANDDV